MTGPTSVPSGDPTMPMPTTPTHPEFLGAAGRKPAPTVSIHDASVNLVAAMVRRAVLDAHPKSPIPEEYRVSKALAASWPKERLAAHAWVMDLFKDKPTTLRWAKSMWKLPYRKAAFATSDKRIERIKPGEAHPNGRRREKNAETRGEGYISSSEAAEILGVSTNCLTNRIKYGLPWAPEHKWFQRGGVRVLGIKKESVLKIAADPLSDTQRIFDRVRRQNFSKRWNAKREEGRDRTNPERQDNRTAGA